MTVKTINFVSGNPREKLACVFVLDDNNTELKKCRFIMMIKTWQWSLN